VNHRYHPLKLAAVDQEDLNIFAACLQDAVVPIAGLNYDKTNGQFHLIANRFCWECYHDDNPNDDDNHPHQRVTAGLHIDHVKSVKKKGFDETHPDGFMNLLTIHNPRKGCINLIFSGGGEIEIKIDKMKCLLSDLDNPYPTSQKPGHPR